VTDTRCPVTELLVEQCAHCRPAPAPDPFDEPARPGGGWFEARYEGRCSHCGFPIEPGEAIRSDGEGGWLCSDCGSER